MGSIPTPGTITRLGLVPVPRVELRHSAVARRARPSGSIPTPGTVHLDWPLPKNAQNTMGADLLRIALSQTGGLAFSVGAGCGLFVVLARSMSDQTVTLFLSSYAWAATSLVLGGDPWVAYPNIVLTVAAVMSGTLLLVMSVVAAILRWSGSDEMTLQLRVLDVAAAIVLYAALCMFPAGRL